MIACPECGGPMNARTNKMFRGCEQCGKVMVVTEEARAEIERVGGDLTVPAPSGLELQEAVTGDIVVPDYTDVMIGWRAWQVDESPGQLPKLLSMNNAEWEHYAVMTATCKYNDKLAKEGKKTHDVPKLKCRCGLYSAKSRKHLLSMRYNAYDPDSGNAVVIGEVNLWGRIVEGTQGWRATHGYPRKLYLPHMFFRLHEPLTEAYGVPVEINNTLRMGPLDKVREERCPDCKGEKGVPSYKWRPKEDGGAYMCPNPIHNKEAS